MPNATHTPGPEFDRDMERFFVGNRQMGIRHFYSIGGNQYAVGYCTPDAFFHQDIYQWDGEQFVRVSLPIIDAAPDLLATIRQCLAVATDATAGEAARLDQIAAYCRARLAKATGQ